jgi:hypothetical protein
MHIVFGFQLCVCSSFIKQLNLIMPFGVSVSGALTSWDLPTMEGMLLPGLTNSKDRMCWSAKAALLCKPEHHQKPVSPAIS